MYWHVLICQCEIINEFHMCKRHKTGPYRRKLIRIHLQDMFNSVYYSLFRHIKPEIIDRPHITHIPGIMLRALSNKILIPRDLAFTSQNKTLRSSHTIIQSICDTLEDYVMGDS